MVWVTDFLYPHMTEGVKVLIRALFLFMKAPPSWFKHLPQTSPTNAIIFGSLDFNI